MELPIPDASSAAAFEQQEETSGDHEVSEVSKRMSLAVAGEIAARPAAGPALSSSSAQSPEPVVVSSEPVVVSSPEAVLEPPAPVSPAEEAPAPRKTPLAVHAIVVTATPPVGSDAVPARNTPPVDSFSESILRWMLQGDSLESRPAPVAEDLSDLDEAVAPILRARAMRAARTRRWLSVAGAIVVGSVAALWVTHVPARPVAVRPAPVALRPILPSALVPPPGSGAPQPGAPATPAPTAAASDPTSTVGGHNRAQSHRRRGANRHHRRRRA